MGRGLIARGYGKPVRAEVSVVSDSQPPRNIVSLTRFPLVVKSQSGALLTFEVGDSFLTTQYSLLVRKTHTYIHLHDITLCATQNNQLY